jgi:hypothetical protein
VLDGLDLDHVARAAVAVRAASKRGRRFGFGDLQLDVRGSVVNAAVTTIALSPWWFVAVVVPPEDRWALASRGSVVLDRIQKLFEKQQSVAAPFAAPRNPPSGAGGEASRLRGAGRSGIRDGSRRC